MKKSIKPFIIGTVVGSLLTVSSVAFADNGIQAIKALLDRSVKVTVNGSAAKLDNPAITYDGKTYVYLKDVSKLLGAQVNWNTKTKTIELKVDPSVLPSKPQVIATYKVNAKEATVMDTEYAKYKTFMTVVNSSTSQMLEDATYKEQFLREYVGYKILYATYGSKEMSAEDKTAFAADFNEFLAQLKTYLGQNPDLKTKLEKSGVTENDMRVYYKMLTLVPKEMENNVTADAIKAEFMAKQADYNIVTVRHILIGTEALSTGGVERTDAEALARAKEVKKLLVDGGNWTALAKEYSEDPGSSDNGGLYENQQSLGWVTEFKDAANTQPIGEIGDPVKTDYGYHVIQVEKRETKSYENLTEQDIAQLRSEIAQARFENFMSNELPGKITKLDASKA
ncbi:peptidylprolyl isomerase [Paenibacillus oenotherae]|uniref:Peptidylprolyl isomerase n=1 Tax=Paenibacillus oenotherae TaxID=1435645 RepID=A0ABS7CZV3_9BACL|nr:peptidylprolyl isomerase [Paenibacillus oenotherae]MBW7473129.1 peptidylprolyl isomerase [Paenibacillus oenotherae]